MTGVCHRPDLNTSRTARIAQICRHAFARLATRGQCVRVRMSQESFVATLVRECPEVRSLVKARIREWNGDIVLHVIVADVRLLALKMFDAHETEALNRCLGVVATGLIHGDGNVQDAVAVSFVERTPWWDTEMVPFIASWPEVLQAEAQRRRPATAGTTETGKPIFVIDGSHFDDLAGFAREISPWLDPDTWWYDGDASLDAFDDVLEGGYGTPECGFVIRWVHSDLSRAALGYKATERWLQRRFGDRIGDRDDLLQLLDDARHGRGPTLFDHIVEIIRGWGPGGTQPSEDIELYLE